MDDSAIASAPLKRLPGRALRLLRGVFALVVAVWIVHILQQAELSAALDRAAGDARTWLLVWAWMVVPAGLSFLWREQIRMGCGAAPKLADTFRIQALAWAGRYLPGKAGLWIAKVGMLEDRRFGPGQLLATVVTEQLLFVVAGALIGIALLVAQAGQWTPGMDTLLAVLENAFPGLPRALPAIALGTVAIGLALAALVIAGRHRLRAWKDGCEVRLPGLGGLGVLLAGHCLLHLMLGLATYPLLALLLPESAQALGVWGTAGAVAIANVAGIAAVFAPAGLGVREVVLAFFVSAGSTMGDALAFAALLRALTLFADVGFSAIAWSIPTMLNFRAARRPAK